MIGTSKQEYRTDRLVGQGDNRAASHWYNAVMNTNKRTGFYNILRAWVSDFVKDPAERNEFMNAAIDAAMFTCGYDYYTHGHKIKAYMMFDAVSPFLSEALDKYLSVFIAWGQI